MAKGGGIIFFCLILFVSCNKRAGSDAIVARVGEKQLSWSDLNEVIPDRTAPDDSIVLAQRYIENWIREQVVLNEAEQNLAEDKTDFESLIENYRKSLLIYAYEQEWVKQKLDTLVSQAEIEKYYEENIQNFQLKDYIVKVKYCAASTEIKQLKQLRKLFYSDDPQDVTPWIRFCVDNGASYYFNEDQWMLWDDFIKQVPINVVDKDAFLKSNRDVELEKDNNLYLIRITDYQLSGSQSPLSFELENIRSMILNRRKMMLLQKMKEDLYSKALAEKEIETYYSAQ